jgi:hypothetical protein
MKRRFWGKNTPYLVQTILSHQMFMIIDTKKMVKVNDYSILIDFNDSPYSQERNGSMAL